MISSSQKATNNYRIHCCNSLSYWMRSAKTLSGKTPFSSTIFCLENEGTQKYVELLLTQQQTVVFGSEFTIGKGWIPRLFSLFPCFQKLKETQEFIYSKPQFQHMLVETILGMLADSNCSKKYPLLLRYITQNSDSSPEVSPILKSTYSHKICWILAKNLTQDFYENCLEVVSLEGNFSDDISDWQLLQKEVWKAMNVGNFFFIQTILPEILHNLQQETWDKGQSCHLPNEIILIGPLPIYRKEIEFLVRLSKFIPITHVFLKPNIKEQEFSSLGISLFGKTKICLQHLESFGIHPSDFCYTNSNNKIISILEKNPHKETPLTTAEFLVTKSPSIWKEVETVHKQILQEFQENPLLELQDVCVLSTDLEKYGEFLSLIFESKTPIVIPTKITGSYGMKYSTICHAIFDLFSLSREKCSVGKFFDIFSHKCIQKGSSIDDEEVSLLNLLQRSYPDIWGYSLEYQREILRTKNPQTPSLEKIFQNLIHCLFVKNTMDREDGLYKKISNQIHVDSLGQVYRIFSNLEQDFSHMYLEKHTIFHWCEKTVSLLQKYIKPINGEQEIEFEQIIKQLSKVPPKLYKNLWPFGCFYEFLQDILNTQQKIRNYGDRGGINIGSIENLAGIEARIIFLLGTSENLFLGKQMSLHEKKEELLILENYEIRNQLLYILLGCKKLYISYSTESSDESPILKEIFWEISRLKNKIENIPDIKQKFTKTTQLIPQICENPIKQSDFRLPNFEEIGNKPPTTISIVNLEDFLKNSIRSFFKKSLNINIPQYSTWNVISNIEPKWDLPPTKINDLLYRILLEGIYNPGKSDIDTEQIKKIEKRVIEFVNEKTILGEVSSHFSEIQISLCNKKIIQILKNLYLASLENDISANFWQNAHLFTLGEYTPQSNRKIEFHPPIQIEGTTLVGGKLLYLTKDRHVIFLVPYCKKSNIISTLVYPASLMSCTNFYSEISLLTFSSAPQEKSSSESQNSINKKNYEYIASAKIMSPQNDKKTSNLFLSESKETYVTFLETLVESYLKNYKTPKMLYESMFLNILNNKKVTEESLAQQLRNAFLCEEKDRTLPHNKISNSNLYPCPYGQRFTSFWGENYAGENPYLGWPEKLLSSMSKILVNHQRSG